MVETARGRVAVRSTSDAVHRHLAAGLPVASDDGPVDGLPHGFGIHPQETRSGFHWLYWGRCPVARTRDAERLVAALEQHLSVPAPQVGDRLILRMSAAVAGDGRALLLPHLGADVARFDRRLREVGVSLVTSPFVTVDPVAGELVVDAPTTRLAAHERRALLQLLGTTTGEPAVDPGRYALDRWLVEDGASTSAQDVATLLSALGGPTSYRSALAVSTMLGGLRKVAVNMRDVTSVVVAARPEPN